MTPQRERPPAGAPGAVAQNRREDDRDTPEGTTNRYLCAEGHLVATEHTRTVCTHVVDFRVGTMCGARLEPAPPPAA